MLSRIECLWMALAALFGEVTTLRNGNSGRRCHFGLSKFCLMVFPPSAPQLNRYRAPEAFPVLVR